MPSKAERDEQRTVLKFLTNSGMSPAQSWQKLQGVFGGNSISKSTVQFWHKRFSQGQTTVAGKKRTGRPKTARSAEQIQAVSTHLGGDRRKTVRQMAEDLGMKKSSVHNIVKKDLGLSKLAPKFIPKILTEEQKRARREWCQLNLDLLKEDEGLLAKIVTGDETWVSVLEIERKESSWQWLPKGRGTRHPVKAMRQRAEKKAMLTVFFDVKGVILAKFTPPPRDTICADSYCETLKLFKERLRRKRPDLWALQDDGWRSFYLQHDNASSHTAGPTIALIGSSNIQMISHPPYSPDLAPSDYFLFPKLKNLCWGRRFCNLNQMKAGVKEALKQIKPEDFSLGISSLPIRWMKCFKANGDFFEGQHIQIDPEADHGLIMELVDGHIEEESDSD